MNKLVLILLIIALGACSNGKLSTNNTKDINEVRISIDEAYNNCVSSISDSDKKLKISNIENFCKCLWDKENNIYGDLDFTIADAYHKQFKSSERDKCVKSNPTIKKFFTKIDQSWDDAIHKNEITIAKKKYEELRQKIYDECITRIENNIQNYNKKSENYFNQVEMTFDFELKIKESCKCEADFMLDYINKNYPSVGFSSKIDEDVFYSKIYAEAVEKCPINTNKKNTKK